MEADNNKNQLHFLVHLSVMIACGRHHASGEWTLFDAYQLLHVLR